ncbi:hypothetical protein Vi05172_g8829 [Venturia inaequalis]|nr:hypothetical protein Vi05172_g8829 [Venturia inaequalis]
MRFSIFSALFLAAGANAGVASVPDNLCEN